MDAADDVTRIAGIGRTFASRLRAREIATIGDLRTRLATTDLRRVVAWETGISERRLETWFRLALPPESPSTAAAPAPPAIPEPEPTPLRAQDGLSGAESAEIALEPIAAEPEASIPTAAPAPPLLPAPEPESPLVVDPIVDDALLPEPAPRLEVAPVDASGMLRSVGRLRTFSLAVLALALVSLATAISMSVSSGEREAAPDPLLSAGATSAAHLARANDLFKGGRFEDAEAEYRRAIALDSSSDEARVQLGRALYRQRRFAEAVKEFREALEGRESVKAHYYLSGALLGMHDPAAALGAARRAIALDPSFLWSYYNLALAWDAIPDAPPLTAIEHRSAVRSLLADVETAEGDAFAQSERLLERLTGHRVSAGDEAFPGAVETLRDGWRMWGEREGLITTASPQPGDAVGEAR